MLSQATNITCRRTGAFTCGSANESDLSVAILNKRRMRADTEARKDSLNVDAFV